MPPLWRTILAATCLFCVSLSVNPLLRLEKGHGTLLCGSVNPAWKSCNRGAGAAHEPPPRLFSKSNRAPLPCYPFNHLGALHICGDNRSNPCARPYMSFFSMVHGDGGMKVERQGCDH